MVAASLSCECACWNGLYPYLYEFDLYIHKDETPVSVILTGEPGCPEEPGGPGGPGGP